jgi:asparagine synthetase B (glutamine-hydrolysing)
MALYFAARGVGRVRSSPIAHPEHYTSSARVLLNGLGSDELLGGYGRHRTAYNTGGWQAVIDEVSSKDSARILSRLFVLVSSNSRWVVSLRAILDVMIA